MIGWPFPDWLLFKISGPRAEVVRKIFAISAKLQIRRRTNLRNIGTNLRRDFAKFRRIARGRIISILPGASNQDCAHAEILFPTVLKSAWSGLSFIDLRLLTRALLRSSHSRNDPRIPVAGNFFWAPLCSPTLAFCRVVRNSDRSSASALEWRIRAGIKWETAPISVFREIDKRPVENPFWAPFLLSACLARADRACLTPPDFTSLCRLDPVISF